MVEWEAGQGLATARGGPATTTCDYRSEEAQEREGKEAGKGSHHDVKLRRWFVEATERRSGELAAEPSSTNFNGGG